MSKEWSGDIEFELTFKVRCSASANIGLSEPDVGIPTEYVEDYALTNAPLLRELLSLIVAGGYITQERVIEEVHEAIYAAMEKEQ